MGTVEDEQVDPLTPNSTLLTKLGSAIVHADEAMSEQGHAADEGAFRSILADPEVGEWLSRMTDLALVPVKRNA